MVMPNNYGRVYSHIVFHPLHQGMKTVYLKLANEHNCLDLTI